MKIERKELMELLPPYVNLCYVNYDADLSGSIDGLQACVASNCWDSLHEELSDYLSDKEYESLKSYKKDLQRDIVSKYDVSEEDAYRLVFDTLCDEIEEILCQRNHSNVINDLLKNTENFSFFIDTGLEVEEGSYGWTRSEQTRWLKKIKQKLKIETNQWDDDIRKMLSEASYGGQLVLYFYSSVETLVNEQEKDWKSVSLTNPAIAIINTDCGSGAHTHLRGHQFTTSFSRKNLFIDRYFKYNYVEAVCGMYQDWCKDSTAVFAATPVKGKKNTPSSLAAKALQDREYALIYSQGKCSFGDVDIRRHRDTYYRNDYPCGHKCPHCGMFWVD